MGWRATSSLCSWTAVNSSRKDTVLLKEGAYWPMHWILGKGKIPLTVWHLAGFLLVLEVLYLAGFGRTNSRWPPCMPPIEELPAWSLWYSWGTDSATELGEPYGSLDNRDCWRLSTERAGFLAIANSLGRVATPSVIIAYRISWVGIQLCSHLLPASKIKGETVQKSNVG